MPLKIEKKFEHSLLLFGKKPDKRQRRILYVASPVHLERYSGCKSEVGEKRRKHGFLKYIRYIIERDLNYYENHHQHMASKKKSKLIGNDDDKGSSIVANRYKVLKQLGKGAYGIVFLVEDIKFANDLKVLKKIHIGKLDPNETDSAVNEARLLSKLDHPGIVKFYDSFIDGEFFCIITEYCEGGDLDCILSHWKRNKKEADLVIVQTWFIQLVLAVQYMHRKKVLHRDLKSRNIFLKNNTVKIGDFGISRILLGTNDIATTFTGTPYFMAPEILKQEGYNSKSDIWSLGVILYEMCTLEKAFPGSNLMSIMFKIVQCDVPDLPARVDPSLKSIYKSMLCKEPKNRISATEVLKKPFIAAHLESLRSKPNSKGMFETKDTIPTKEVTTTKMRSKLRPLTPKEEMKLRKQRKAEENAERLKKITLYAYEESRMKRFHIKEKQVKVHKVLENNFCEKVESASDTNDNSEFKQQNYGRNLLEKNNRKQNGESFRLADSEENSFATMLKEQDNADNNNPDSLDSDFIFNNQELSKRTDPHGSETNKTERLKKENVWNKNKALPRIQCPDQTEHCTNNVSDYDIIYNHNNGNLLTVQNQGGRQEEKQYTHCYDEGDGDFHIERLEHRRHYTHCFGEDSSEEENEKEADDEVFDDTLIQASSSLTLVSNIPEDDELANTYYSTHDDFEEEDDDDNDDDDTISDNANSDNDDSEPLEDNDFVKDGCDVVLDDYNDTTEEYNKMVGCMEDVLNSTENCGGRKSTMSDLSTMNSTSIRQEKIQSLRNECIKLLGKEGFEKVYSFLKKVRFESARTIKEDDIMKKLRKLVGSTRDCFLVDQLIFMEKSNQILEETF